MCFKSILQISHSSYLQSCSNLPVKFANFLTVSIAFYVYKKTLRLNNFKTRTVINAKVSMFVIFVEATIYFHYMICITVPLSNHEMTDSP